MPDKKYAAVVLVMRADGMVRTDLADGRTVYLTEGEFWAFRQAGTLPTRDLEVAVCRPS